MAQVNVTAFPAKAKVPADFSGDSKAILSSLRSKELFFAVVGPVGAGGSRAIKSLERACVEAGYQPETVRVSELIKTWTKEQGKELPSFERKTLDNVKVLQDLGDEMRKADPSALARVTLAEIARRRAARTGVDFKPGEAVPPGDEKVAYLIDSIRHPAEKNLFRRTYANAFALVGVVCEEQERVKRILDKYLTVPEQQNNELVEQAKAFISRDADDEIAVYGQHVTKAFFEADFFVDNTARDVSDKDQFLDEPLSRLVSIVSHDRIIRPTIEETAMHHAHSARVRSACLSRQVGAALVDFEGTVLATGTNEVPKAGGGVYGEQFAEEVSPDDRCAFRPEQFCSSNREQNRIIDDLINVIPELTAVDDRVALRRSLRKTAVGQLIEFSRAVHAEMDALMSAGRDGVTTSGTRLFVTTFPCHYCARHIVSAGVHEVQFIEPYPKSLALNLHKDAITVDASTWIPPGQIHAVTKEEATGVVPAGTILYGKVLFRPFVGVAPRLYLRAFEKIRDLKDKETGDLKIGEPEWGDEWSPFVVAYPEIEAALSRAK
ncbi:MAG: deoxycytidylate deaminase [Alphaproteobacteria bacterium]|nr:MAG: deoxycytidylate deaminase [Alphaproteobacteria bacterium]